MEELIPACSKVNLDYFFARTDIDRFGVSIAHSTESGEINGSSGRAALERS
jgi:hypothetical protein